MRRGPAVLAPSPEPSGGGTSVGQVAAAAAGASAVLGAAYLVTRDGSKSDKKKVKDIEHMPRPGDASGDDGKEK